MSWGPAAASIGVVSTIQETPRLVRRTDRRWIAGVAGGLGDHFGIPPAWFRLAFVVSFFLAGAGLAAYLLLWFVIPRADRPSSAAQRVGGRWDDAPAWIGIGLIALGALSLTSRISGALGIHLGSLAWALLLIGGGLALYRPTDAATRARAAAPIGVGTPEVATPPMAVEEPTSPLPIPTPRIEEPRRTRRERSPLGWVVLGFALAASGIVAMLREAGTLHWSLSQALAVPLTIIGAGLLVGTVIGRARWTVLPGLLLLPVVMAASAFTVPLNGRWSDVSISRLGQLSSSYEQSGGRVFLDLSGMETASLPPAIHVRLGAGEVEVILPRHGVRVDATVNVGAIDTGAGARGGLSLADSRGDSSATSVVTVHVDVGNVRVWYGPRISGG
jgi:phage shock protein PspC (stress-responsive transcriptional regulator)